MPSGTYIALANLTLTAPDSSVVFSNIPNTYKDLVITVSGTTNSDNRAFYIRFNNQGEDVNTSMVVINNASAATDVGLYIITDTTRFLNIINIMDYSATDKHKTLLMRGNRPSQGSVNYSAGRWSVNDAVTSISLDRSGYSWQSGTNFALYGIAG